MARNPTFSWQRAFAKRECLVGWLGDYRGFKSVFACKPAPTFDLWGVEYRVRHKSLVGAGVLAKRPANPTNNYQTTPRNCSNNIRLTGDSAA